MPPTLLITRPQAAAEAFAAQVEQALPGAYAPLISPLLTIRSEPCDLDLSDVQALLFTSANGVAEFAARWPDRDLPALCVGGATARAAQAAGLSVSVAGGDVAELAQLAALSYHPGAGAMLHLRGVHAAGDLTGALLGEGIEAREEIVYDQHATPLSEAAEAALAAGTVRAVTLFSRRMADLFMSAPGAEAWDLGRCYVLGLSAAIVEPLPRDRFAGRMAAREPTAAGMIAALSALHRAG